MNKKKRCPWCCLLAPIDEWVKGLCKDCMAEYKELAMIVNKAMKKEKRCKK